MLGNFLIGLREGLEAALVVSILIAFLVRTDRRAALPKVWIGVGLAVAVSVGVTLALALAQQALTFQAEEMFGGSLSIIAVGFVTWMIFWMRRTARHLSGELRGRLDDAVQVGGGAVVVMAALAVSREGLETELFFFTISGVLLIFVAAGILAYGVHDLREADVLPGLASLAFDVSDAVPGLLVRRRAQGDLQLLAADDRGAGRRVGGLRGHGARPVPAVGTTTRAGRRDRRVGRCSMSRLPGQDRWRR